MGKYMRKAKAASEVAVMEVSQASLGVRTRAKTLALQRLQKSPPVSKSPRSTRESTPSNLIRDPDIIRTPGSTTKQTNSAETTNRRTQNSSQRHIPTAHEMDEFFAGAEVEQQKQFIDKYNFDPVNEKPLPGRYSWEKVVS
uniref:Cyclin-dependent kinase inhibitor domain-containing protein n=1 Tax=Cannabis sativa TaxID=3483 RepID=A0A803Q2N1_CANSA